MPTSSKKAAPKFKKRIDDFLARRPHRTLRLTRRRDYIRPLALPGYISFTHFVNQTLWKNKRLFLWLAAIYAALSIFLVGIGSQETYSSLNETINEEGQGLFEGAWGQVERAGLLFSTVVSNGLNDTPTGEQQIYTILLVLMVWLVSVWVLRNILAGHKVKIRDGLYNAGAPLLSTFLVALMLILQLLPVAIAAIAYAAAQSSGLLAGGVEAMLFWVAAGLLAILSLFWVTSTIFALIIVTLPGMYPWKAIRSAGDLVLGRRIAILLRWLWMALMIGITWVVVLIPVILIDMWLKSAIPQIEGLPVVPLAIVLLGTFTVIWSSAYAYLLYRKVVDNDAQ